MSKFISIACDHAGFWLKNFIKTNVLTWCFEDRGCYFEEVVDYPDFALLVVQDLLTSFADFGILICGTGVGMSICANRHKHIRAALCYDLESARLAREHNNANILCLGSRKVDQDLVIGICHEFVNTAFADGRHRTRINKIDGIE